MTGGRRRVLLAPITVTPSKPLTPSHLKGLLWTDVMFRATAHLADVTYRYSHTTYHPTEQTLGFWEFLDRSHGDVDYDALSEEEVGELYVRFRAERRPLTAADVRPYAEAVERTGYVHPASARVLRLWSRHYERLGLHDPGLLARQPPGFGLEEMIRHLVAAGLGLDQRYVGGPVYLDATRHGLPLRQIVTADGRPNYLACALRELLPLAPCYDETVLLYDRELDPDYQLVERALTGTGTTVHRVPIGRVPIDGKITSARHGGWHSHTTDVLLRTLGDEYDPAALRLGMRLYFIATLGPGQRESFRYDLLRKSLARAEQLLSRARETPRVPGALPALLARHRRAHTHVDPYRLTSSLLGRSRRPPANDLLTTVFI
ncbi:hypothetical protein [Streptomyces sporangiiformans]|uniref:Uncharacterized protein n=1 Tax=Streptomyces sporangiiformans TaxID=2315329 RepID=A0A505D2C1_9ACTN|nr:hypothetical protein [Streptomyces sporangiiformans]TPQ18603.1 hypothetical protein FGD71_030065 [Streptomyces sporangiiformans]